MDQTKRTNEVSRDENERHGITPASKELRTLDEYELVLCGGGDEIINWPK